MGEAMLRFSEFVESPEFRGGRFTITQFRQEYIAQHGKWDFCTQFIGFNLTDKNILPFKDGGFGRLSADERTVLDAVGDKTGKYCVIAVKGGDLRTLLHETAHAYYYLSPQYRSEVKELLKTVPARELLEASISAEGYHNAVLSDELHAYLVDGSLFHCTDSGQYLNKRTKKKILKIGVRLQRLFRQYAAKQGLAKPL